MECFLPVSLGEAIDKYTILQIKEKKIKDKSRLGHVQKERRVIESQLESVLKKEQVVLMYRTLYCSNHQNMND